MREKRVNGLCFRCDEPFTREHRCKNRQFRMIILEAKEEEVEEEEQEYSLQTFKSLQLSLCSMSGFTTSKS